jgi:hypothetical protein
MLAVIAEPYVIAELASTSGKFLFLGFDSNARAIEVITDTGASGQVFVIHADKITPSNEKILEEALK